MTTITDHPGEQLTHRAPNRPEARMVVATVVAVFVLAVLAIALVVAARSADPSDPPSTTVPGTVPPPSSFPTVTGTPGSRLMRIELSGPVTVTSQLKGVVQTCETDTCVYAYAPGVVDQLTAAVTSPGYVVDWEGDCAGTPGDAPCSLNLLLDRVVRARAHLPAPQLVRVYDSYGPDTGDHVLVEGFHLDTVTAVDIAGAPVPFSLVSQHLLAVTVPAGVGKATLTVTNENGAATSQRIATTPAVTAPSSAYLSIFGAGGIGLATLVLDPVPGYTYEVYEASGAYAIDALKLTTTASATDLGAVLENQVFIVFAVDPEGRYSEPRVLTVHV